jgi:hypothetical protein
MLYTRAAYCILLLIVPILASQYAITRMEHSIPRRNPITITYRQKEISNFIYSYAVTPLMILGPSDTPGKIPITAFKLLQMNMLRHSL